MIDKWENKHFGNIFVCLCVGVGIRISYYMGLSRYGLRRLYICDLCYHEIDFCKYESADAINT